MPRIVPGLLITALAISAAPEASALITGGEGNRLLADPGWPKGAGAIFNHPGRAAWWEGPPFGGGQWHAECRGDVRALNAVLVDFARLDVKFKRVVVHDGTGHSFWLAPNREPDKLAAAKIDWVFMVWQPANWEQLHKLPADLNPTDAADSAPLSQLDVYTANVDWAGVIVPRGIQVLDNRLAAHGFSAADGVVLEGKVTDLETKGRVAATMKLQRIDAQAKGGYRYTVVAETRADAWGRWVLKKAPAGWFRLLVEAKGFAPRVIGHARLDDQPCWQSIDCGLARPATVSGRIIDEDGKAMADVDVKLSNVQAGTGGRYESPTEHRSKTDAEGRFRAEGVPVGKASLRAHKRGYFGPGLGLSIATPKSDVELTMRRAASVRVTVDFRGKKRPEGYLVSLKPEGGLVVGSHGGSGNIDAENLMTFEILPPGRYVLSGRPNPGSDAEGTESVTLELKGGQLEEVTLIAK